jgi:hypothetical protein
MLSIVFSGYTVATGYDFQWLQQMYCIQVVTSCVVKGYVQGAEVWVEIPSLSCSTSPRLALDLLLPSLAS